MMNRAVAVFWLVVGGLVTGCGGGGGNAGSGGPVPGTPDNPLPGALAPVDQGVTVRVVIDATNVKPWSGQGWVELIGTGTAARATTVSYYAVITAAGQTVKATFEQIPEGQYTLSGFLAFWEGNDGGAADFYEFQQPIDLTGGAEVAVNLTASNNVEPEEASTPLTNE